MVGFIGPNGAGNSSTIKALMGFLIPDGGEARLLGQGDGRETGEDEHHSGLTTRIPSARRDFRGLLGDLERQVHPYFDADNHRHESPDQAIPPSA